MNNDYLHNARSLEPELTAFMQDIIRIPSLSSQEGDVIARIREEMEKLGYDEVTVDPMGNLIGRISIRWTRRHGRRRGPGSLGQGTVLRRDRRRDSLWPRRERHERWRGIERLRRRTDPPARRSGPVARAVS